MCVCIHGVWYMGGEDGREREGKREGRGREDKDAVLLWLAMPLSK